MAIIWAICPFSVVGDVFCSFAYCWITCCKVCMSCTCCTLRFTISCSNALAPLAKACPYPSMLACNWVLAPSWWVCLSSVACWAFQAFSSSWAIWLISSHRAWVAFSTAKITALKAWVLSVSNSFPPSTSSCTVPRQKCSWWLTKQSRQMPDQMLPKLIVTVPVLYLHHNSTSTVTRYHFLHFNNP